MSDFCLKNTNYSDKDIIIVLGGNELHAGFVDVKKRLGIKTIIVIDWNEDPAYQGDVHYKMDIKDYEGISALPIEWDRVLFVYTSADIAVDVQIRLHKKLGLAYPSNDSVQNCLIKGLMTRCWTETGIINKYSVVVDTPEEFIPQNNMNYIFKPNMSSGSRGITILSSDDIAEENYYDAIQSAKDVSYDDKCIVEEFVNGTEFTIEMLGDNHGNVAVFGISKKYHTSYNKTNRIATKLHYSPGDVSEDTLCSLADFGIECYKSVGLRNSLGHLEVLLKSDGTIVPVEIGARSSGYIATHLLDLINDESFLYKYVDVLNGGSVNNGIQFDCNRSSMYYFYDIIPGISSDTCSIMDFLPDTICSVAFDRSRIIKNQVFEPIQADGERYGFEILHGLRKELTIETVNRAERDFNNKFIRESCRDVKDLIIDYLKRNRVSTTEVADVLGKKGVVSGVYPISAGQYKVGEVVYIYAYEESNWPVHEQIQGIDENKIIFVDEFDCQGRAIFGELVSKYLLLYKQSVALIVNGALRDAASLLKEKWPIWCKGFNPVGCFNLKPSKEPPLVIRKFMEYYEGAIAVCDDCGVVIVPKDNVNWTFLNGIVEMEKQEDVWFDRLDHFKENTFEIVCQKKYLNDKDYLQGRK